MYESYWGLRASPFTGAVDPQWFVELPSHEEALARCWFLVEQGRRCGLLVGPSGVGKSLVLAVFAQQVRRTHRRVGHVSVAGRGPRELLIEVAEGLGLMVQMRCGTWELERRLRDDLVAAAYEQRDTVLLIDDAESLEPAAAPVLDRLLRSGPLHRERITCILAVEAEEGRASTAGEGPVAQGSRWSMLRYAELVLKLDPLSVEGTRRYVSELLSRAGGQRGPEGVGPAAALDDAAFERLHELSGGVPRKINRLCDLALLAAVAQDMTTITPEVIDAVHRDFFGVVDRGTSADSVRARSSSRI